MYSAQRTTLGCPMEKKELHDENQVNRSCRKLVLSGLHSRVCRGRWRRALQGEVRGVPWSGRRRQARGEGAAHESCCERDGGTGQGHRGFRQGPEVREISDKLFTASPC